MKMHHTVIAPSQRFQLENNSRKRSDQAVSCRVSVVLLARAELLVLLVPLEAVVPLAHQALMVTRYAFSSCHCLTVELLMNAIQTLSPSGKVPSQLVHTSIKFMFSTMDDGRGSQFEYRLSAEYAVFLFGDRI